LLTGIIFTLIYTISGIFVGSLADRFNRSRIIGCGVIIWSFFTALSGLAKNFVQLAIPRFFIGVGESSITPSTMSVLADRFGKQRLGFAAGFYYMGVPVGVGVALLIAGFLGPVIGWRGSFYLLGGIGVALGLLMLFVKDHPRTKLPQKTETNKRSFKEVLALLFEVLGKSKSLGLTILAGTLYHFVLGAAAFDIRWAVVDKGFEADFYLQINSLVFLVFGVAGSVFGGAMSDWALKKYNLPRTWFLLILTFVLMPLAFTRYADPTSVIFWIGIISSAFSTGCFYGPVFSAIQEVVPANIRGSVVAFNLLCINLVGYSLGSYTAGLSIDYLLEIGVSQPYTHVLVASVVIYLLTGPICYYLAGKHYDADKKALEMQFSKET